MKLKHWVAFALVQLIGFVLPTFANVHMRLWPLFAGVALLLPGSILGVIRPMLDGFILVPAMLAVNAVSWYLVARFGRIALIRSH